MPDSKRDAFGDNQGLRIFTKRSFFYAEHGEDQYCPCELCKDKWECLSVFDLYNTDDDCLESK